MITCHVRYEIDAAEADACERFARRWMELVPRNGGTHHGYFLPAEGASDIAYALFSFPTLAEYERYRERFGVVPSSWRRTGSATNRAVCGATSGRSCGRC